MRILAVWFCLLGGLLLPGAQAQDPPGSRHSVQLLGRDYLPLREWAAANGFKFTWNIHRKGVALTRPGQSLEFAINSAEFLLNDVNVWLAHPVVLANGTPCVSAFDFQTGLQPLIFPTRNPAAKKINLVVLDPGHGGKDTGNRVGQQNEKKYTLLLAGEIRQQLKKSGIKVALTRSGDDFVELPDRPAKAQRLGADLFVSLHFNATEEGRNEVRGSEVYCLTPAGASSTNAHGEGADSPWVTGNRNNDKNILLAYDIQHSLLHNLGVEDRGVRRARFAVLRDALMPAALIEAGFMSHPVEGQKIFDPAYRHQMAIAIANGILAYKRQVER